jgi:hypothetical protein
MNLVITAGTDNRMQYNFLALGGASIANVLNTTAEKRILRYLEEIARDNNTTTAKILNDVKKNLTLEPYVFAPFLNPDHTKLLLATFDSTVPFQEGLKLRKLLNYPSTIFVASGHATSLLYSQFFQLLRFNEQQVLLPVPYLEAEIINFFQTKMRPNEGPFASNRLKIVPYRIAQTPLNLMAELVQLFSY